MSKKKKKNNRNEKDELKQTAAAEEVPESEGDTQAAEETPCEPAAEDTDAKETDDAASEEPETENEAAETEEASEKDSEDKKDRRRIICAVIGGVLLVAAIVVFAVYGRAIKYAINNPYNKDYVNVRSETVGDFAKMSGRDYDEFLKEYELPADMPKSTNMTAAAYTIPAWKYAELSYMTFEEFKTAVGLDDTVTGNTPIGEVFDSMTVAQRVGADKVEQFKKEFNLDDSVTASTKWVKVRNVVDTEMKKRYEQNKNGGVNRLPSEATEAPTE